MELTLPEGLAGMPLTFATYRRVTDFHDPQMRERKLRGYFWFSARRRSPAGKQAVLVRVRTDSQHELPTIATLLTKLFDSGAGDRFLVAEGEASLRLDICELKNLTRFLCLVSPSLPNNTTPSSGRRRRLPARQRKQVRGQ